jgi:glucosyl-3-phosphoglycerate synthase
VGETRAVDDVHGALDGLVRQKEASGLLVSVCIPARNEAATISAIVDCVSRLAHAGLVDELLVMDDGSTDATADLATAAGAKVVAVESVLPEQGPGSGKGEVLWKSLWASTGDLVCWVDGDIFNFGSHFVTRLLAPMLERPDCAFVKGHYERPVGEDPLAGGRVTELVARPMISRFFPELARFPQPLSGEYAGRRRALEQVPFVQGWGVDLGLLIDLERTAGIDAMAAADLGVRMHRNQKLRDLGPQAMAVQSVVLRRAGKIPSGPGSPDHETLLRPGRHGEIEGVPIEIRERPPMRDVPGYARRRR